MICISKNIYSKNINLRMILRSFVCREWSRELSKLILLFPSRSHCFPLSKEFYSTFSIKVQVPCEWLFTSCKWKHRQRHRNRYINSYLSTLDLTLEFMSCWSRTSENSTTVTPSISIYEIDSLLKSVYSNTD